MQGRILIVDDELGPRESLRMILKDKYELALAEDGRKALDLVTAEDFDLILMDIKMPRMTGIEALQAIKAVRKDVEVLILTGYGSLDTAIRAMRYGAYDYVAKPFDKDDILRLVEKGLMRRRNALQLAAHGEEIERLTGEVERDYAGTLTRLIEQVDWKDTFTLPHSLRVAHLAFHLGLAAGMEPGVLQDLRHGGLVHDLGKALVDGAPVEHHPALGGRILRGVLGACPLADWVEQHHERSDGSGYPMGLTQNQMPRESALLSLVNAFDRLVYPPQGESGSLEQALKSLLDRSGTWFDSSLCRILSDLPQLESLCKEPEPGSERPGLLARFRTELEQVAGSGRR